MCLIVYLGSMVPFEFDAGRSPDGGIGLAPADCHPAALLSMTYVAIIASIREGQPTCSCVFHEASLPWEAFPEAPETLAAFAKLRDEVKGHIAIGATPLVFAAWTGTEDDAPILNWRLDAEHLRPGFQLFQGGHLIAGGVPPDTYLLEFVPGLREPEHRIAACSKKS
jgi:hypothetical protein